MKRDLAINIIGGTVATIVGGIVMWKLESRFKDNPAERKAPVTVATSSTDFSKSANRLSPEALTPRATVSSGKSSLQTAGSHYVNAAALSDRKPITPVAVKGSAHASRDVMDALAVPLKQGVFTRTFFSDGVFESALNGKGSGIAQLKLPQEVHKVVLLQVGESQKTSIADAQGAIKIKRHVAITVVEAQSGAVIKMVKFNAEGVGFDEEFAEKSLKEDLAAKLEPVRLAL